MSYATKLRLDRLSFLLIRNLRNNIFVILRVLVAWWFKNR